MESPSSLAKAGWMTLTLLPESKSTNTDFFGKVMGYQIYETYAKFSGYLPLSPPSLAPAVSTVSTVSIAFFLIIVTRIEVAKIDTSFLTLSWDF